MINENINNMSSIKDVNEVCVGGCGLGMTSYIMYHIEELIKSGESVFIMDFVKDFHEVNNKKQLISKEKLITIDLSKEDCLFGLSYNEAPFNSSMSDLEKLNIAALKSKEFVALMESAALDFELEEDLSNFLSACGKIVFVKGKNNIKDVLDFIEYSDVRNTHLNSLSSIEKKYLKEELTLLNSFYANGSSSISKIDEIISIFKQDPLLSSMYNTDSSSNIDFINCIEQGKVVILKEGKDVSLSKLQTNVIVAFFMGKIWLSSKLRAMNSLNAVKKCTVVLDELTCNSSCLKALKRMIPTSRVLGVKFVLSAINPGDISPIRKKLEDCNAIFNILTGSTPQTFKDFQDIITDVSLDDFTNMPNYHALCLLKNGDDYSTKIIKMKI